MKRGKNCLLRENDYSRIHFRNHVATVILGIQCCFRDAFTGSNCVERNSPSFGRVGEQLKSAPFNKEDFCRPFSPVVEMLSRLNILVFGRRLQAQGESFRPQ